LEEGGGGFGAGKGGGGKYRGDGVADVFSSTPSVKSVAKRGGSKKGSSVAGAIAFHLYLISVSFSSDPPTSADLDWERREERKGTGRREGGGKEQKKSRPSPLLRPHSTLTSEGRRKRNSLTPFPLFSPRLEARKKCQGRRGKNLEKK